MKTLRLNTWERIRLANMIGSIQSDRELNVPMRRDLRFVRQCVRLLDVLELSEGEREEVNFRATVLDDRGSIGVQWDRERDRDFELQFEDADAEFLKKLGTSYTNWEPSREVDMLGGKIEAI